ncbi:MAG: ATP-binding protein [Pseudomonadota bacterium]
MRALLVAWLLALLPGGLVAQSDLRVIFNEFRPYQYVDDAGQPAGYGVELVQALAARIGAEIEFIVVANPAEVVAALQSGAADLTPVLVQDPGREDAVIFSVAHETIIIRLYALRRNASQVRESWPVGTRVGISEGSYPGVVAARFDQAIPVATPSNIETLSRLLTGEIDAAMYPEIAFHETVALLDTRRRFEAIGPPLDEVPLRLGISHLRPGLADRLNPILSDFIASAEYRDLHDRTLGEEPGIFATAEFAYAIGTIATLVSAVAGLLLIRARRKASRDLLKAAERTALIERRAADELREKNTALVAKNKAMEELIYVVSHDLSSPLVSISGFARGAMRAQHAGQAEKATQFLERVEANVGSMSSLIKGILQVSHIGQETPQPKEIQLSDIVAALELRLDGVLTARGINLVAVSDVTLVVDPDMLSRALQNIVENAAKYGCEAPDATIEVGATTDPGMARIFVSDSGPGIPDYLQPRVFEMYQRRDDGSAGSGLGLTIVSRLIEKLGGSVSFTTSDQGTTFWVHLPDLSQSKSQITAPMQNTAS